MIYVIFTILLQRAYAKLNENVANVLDALCNCICFMIHCHHQSPISIIIIILSFGFSVSIYASSHQQFTIMPLIITIIVIFSCIHYSKNRCHHLLHPIIIVNANDDAHGINHVSYAINLDLCDFIFMSCIFYLYE